MTLLPKAKRKIYGFLKRLTLLQRHQGAECEKLRTGMTLQQIGVSISNMTRMETVEMREDNIGCEQFEKTTKR